MVRRPPGIRSVLAPLAVMLGMVPAVFVAAVPAVANDFADGLAAYDGGDYRAAARHWKKAAAAGNVDAMTSLAGLYMAAQGVALNVETAARWYRMAAERGDVAAQVNLGDLLSEGSGLPHDRIQAFMWLGLAARQGNAWAEERHRALAAGMTAAELSEARSRLNAWRAKSD
ncbi:MAG: tetratricopeptide repeat protein [Rhodospirillales bacterium]